MQRVCPVPGGIKSYLEQPEQLVTGATRCCPYCASRHPLRCHGWYERWALLPDPEPEQRVAVRRLLCAVTGRTMSLLPDFCLPRRQHGPEILGCFLSGIVRGARVSSALQRVRRRAGHAVAQALLRGFLGRRAFVLEYLASCRARAPTPQQETRPQWRDLALLVGGLCAGCPEVGAAFRGHGRAFHTRFGIGLA